MEPKREVVYCSFQDGTGVVLAALDGEWNHKIWDGVEVVTGNVQIPAGDLITGAVSTYNGHTHGYTHGGLSSGADTTSQPK